MFCLSCALTVLDVDTLERLNCLGVKAYCQDVPGTDAQTWTSGYATCAYQR